MDSSRFALLHDDLIRSVLDFIHEDDVLAVKLTCHHLNTLAHDVVKCNYDAVYLSSVPRLIWGIEQMKVVPTARFFTEAAALAATPVLEYLKAAGCPRDADECESSACARGDLNVLRWMHENDFPFKNTHNYRVAGSVGDLDVVDWLRSVDCPMTAALSTGAFEGTRLCVLDYIDKHNLPIMRRGAYMSVVASEQIDYLKIPVLEWIRERSDELLDQDVFDCAAMLSGIQVLEWLLLHECPFGNTTHCYAASFGRIDVLQWLRDANCPMDFTSSVLISGFASLDTKVLDWILANAEDAHEIANWNLWEGAFEDYLNGIPLKASSILCVLDWLFIHCPFDDDIAYVVPKAVETGSIPLVAWFVNKGVPVIARCLQVAAYRGDMQMLRWLLLYDCSKSEDLCNEAAFGGQLSMLKWLVENNIDKPCARTYLKACMAGSTNDGGIAIMIWLQEQGVLMDREVCRVARQFASDEIRDWLQTNGWIVTNIS